MDSIQDSTRYVVSKVHHGNIMPGFRKEMMRDVTLLTNAWIKGGIWANDLKVIGHNINVDQAIFAQGSLKIENDENEKPKSPEIQFASTITASDSILVKNYSGKIRFMSDCYSEKIHLENSIVYGNIFATDAIIENCIVLGGVYSKNKLEISNSILSTFRADEVLVRKNVNLFFPFALSNKPIKMEEPIKALTFFNIFNHKEKGENSTTKIESGSILCDENDVQEVFQKDHLITKDEQGDNHGNKKLYMLNITNRILDTVEIGKYFRFNKKFIEQIILGTHYSKDNMKKTFYEPVHKLEKKLWSILSKSKGIKELDGGTGLDDVILRIQKEFNS